MSDRFDIPVLSTKIAGSYRRSIQALVKASIQNHQVWQIDRHNSNEATGIMRLSLISL
ncbi:MAG: hypothetical protein MUF72_07805 [Elainella sp. Prado103]|nr:hypothetical protein [Elainella sp. Prado103]